MGLHRISIDDVRAFGGKEFDGTDILSMLSLRRHTDGCPAVLAEACESEINVNCSGVLNSEGQRRDPTLEFLTCMQ